MHKKEVLEFLIYLGACKDAIKWIENHPSNNAETVYNDCKDWEYFRWLHNALNKDYDVLKPPWKVIERYIRNYPIRWR